MLREVLEPGAARVAVFTGAQTLIGMALIAAFVDFDLATFQFWRMGLLAIITFLAAGFWDISENRRVASNLEGLLFVPAMFLIGPAELIVGRVIGGHFGLRRKVGTPYKVWFNTAAQFMVISGVVAAAERVGADRLLAQTTVEQAALVGATMLATYSAFVPVWTMFFFFGNFGYVPRRVLHDSLSSEVIVIVEFALGTLVLMAMVTSMWMFGPILAIIALLIYMGARSTRHWVLRAGMDHVLELSRWANQSAVPEETFSVVRRSAEKLGDINDVVIAHIDEHDKVSFDPEPGSVIGREVASADRLRALAQQRSLHIASFANAGGAVGVWRLSETTEDFLVIYSDRKRISLRNFWQAADILSQHAALIHTTTSQRRALEQRTRTDDTTGLFNRVALIERLEEAIDATEPLVLLAVRVNGLASLQQVLGERVANAELRGFVDRVMKAEHFEFAARVRDDVVMFLSGAPMDEATEAARGIVSNDQHQADALRAVAVSIIDIRRAESVGAEGLLSDCSVTLARAERDDLKVARFDDRDAETARRRFAIGAALPEAIDQGQIFPVFQPQISIATGELTGCEVLARWVHPELGFVSPVEFIEVAEQSNMIEPLTESMLAAACAARARWIEQGIDVDLSVNISARSLRQPGFIEHIAGLFARSGLGQDDLTIELTESSIAEDDSATAESLELLHRIGAMISIDDFGTGYSALAYLHRLPVDEVKIDKSMVMALGQERDPTSVVEGLIKICHSLGIRVVAEGVETDDVLARLAVLGCDIAQGYLFAKPMAEEEWRAWAHAWSARVTPRSRAAS